VGETETGHTGTARGTEQTVLVVDDERHIADLYTTWLEKHHDVRTAYGGEEALEKADEDVDIIFLDRRMPQMSGEEMLDRVRERGLDCRVVMVSAADPEFEIVEMPVDDYLTKPVMREDLDEAIEDMQEREEHDEMVQEYLELTSKKATLDARTTLYQRQESEEYQQMVRRVDELVERADDAVTETATSSARSGR